MSKDMKTLLSKLHKKSAAEIYADSIQYTSSKTPKIIMIILTVMIIGIFFVTKIDKKPYETQGYRMVVGDVWEGAPLIADFSFPIYKSKNEYLEDRRLAAETTLPVFLYDETIQEIMLNKLDNNILVLNEMESNVNESSEFSYSERFVKPLFMMKKEEKDLELKKLQKTLDQYIRKSYSSGFVNISLEKMNVADISVKRSANEYSIMQVSNLTDKNLFLINAEKVISQRIITPLQPLALEIINKVSSPNLQFSKELTDKAVELSMISVPQTSGYVRKNEVIVKNGDFLTQELILKINSYQSSNYMTGDTSVSILYYIGGIGHGAIVSSILLMFIFILRKKIFADITQLSILMMVLIVTSALAWLTSQVHSTLSLELLIFIPALSMLVAIVYDSRTAFYTTVTMALLLAGIRGNDYVTGTIMMFTGIIAAYTVRDIQSRTQMYLSFFYIFIGFAIAILIFGAERATRLDEVFMNLILGFINSIMAPLITFGLLFIIERFSNISTDLRIKEYDNLDHPLLRLLSEKAPGTYQHTLSVALLAERCSREIGANPLLAKVGAYYHDLGKMSKSEYFTENQMGIDNKHDIINARRSARIIIDHVNDGIKLAQEHKLPQRLIDFIPMHHGTTLVKHFYAKALELAIGTDEEVNQNDFRYPGPKPQNKETAILMICDFAEAISRLEFKTTDEIEVIIENNIYDRITDGQFDDCEITLDDLSKIRKVIAKNLIGMTHKRVSYKEIPKKEN